MGLQRLLENTFLAISLMQAQQFQNSNENMTLGSYEIVPRIEIRYLRHDEEFCPYQAIDQVSGIIYSDLNCDGETDIIYYGKRLLNKKDTNYILEKRNGDDLFLTSKNKLSNLLFYNRKKEKRRKLNNPVILSPIKD